MEEPALMELAHISVSVRKDGKVATAKQVCPINQVTANVEQISYDCEKIDQYTHVVLCYNDTITKYFHCQ